VEYVESKGVRTTQPEDKEYFMNFVEDATPADGEAADEITIWYGKKTKNTVMKYNRSTGKYEYNQYGKLMKDQITGEVEDFDNVLIIRTQYYENYIYTATNFRVGGTGYYATGGKLIPIVWKCTGEDPIECLTEDGEPLNVNVGNTYLSLIGLPTETVDWKEVIPPETEPVVVETTEETIAETVPETTGETVAGTVVETTGETIAETTVETQ
jgi:hypothetical protein